MTTIAIVSDIHANVVALDAVLAELEEIGLDQVVCLGDVAATGPAPAQVVARLRARDWRFVRGNCDDAMVQFATGTANPPDDEHSAIDQWCTTQLSADEIAFIAAFEPVVAVDAGGVAICCYHGSPKSNLDEVRMDTAGNELSSWFVGHNARVYAGGHTHVQMARRHMESLVINPGSVGLPFTETAGKADANPFWAEYAMIRVDDGRLGVELRRTPVDQSRFYDMLAGSKMPHRDWWSGDWMDIR
jgi:predicted phosphodiesterase